MKSIHISKLNNARKGNSRNRKNALRNRVIVYSIKLRQRSFPKEIFSSLPSETALLSFSEAILGISSSDVSSRRSKVLRNPLLRYFSGYASSFVIVYSL